MNIQNRKVKLEEGDSIKKINKSIKLIIKEFDCAFPRVVD